MKYPWDVQHGFKKTKDVGLRLEVRVLNMNTLFSNTHISINGWFFQESNLAGVQHSPRPDKWELILSLSLLFILFILDWGWECFGSTFFSRPHCPLKWTYCVQQTSSAAAQTQKGGERPSEELEPSYCGVLAPACEMRWVGSTRGACQGETYRGLSGVPTRLVK